MAVRKARLSFSFCKEPTNLHQEPKYRRVRNYSYVNENTHFKPTHRNTKTSKILQVLSVGCHARTGERMVTYRTAAGRVQITEADRFFSLRENGQALFESYVEPLA